MRSLPCGGERDEMRKQHFGSGSHSRSSREIRRRDAFTALLVLAFLAAALSGVFFLIRSWENARFQPPSTEDSGERPDSSGAVEIEGVTYLPKRNLETYLFLGIDVEGPARAAYGYIGGGQADVQMVLVIDHAEQSWQLLQLNRDSMVNVPVLGVNGAVVGTEFEQLCLAHTHGDGLKKSCINNVNAVSDLLWGQPFDGYLSLHMDGVAILNDAVGGVTVEITSDFSHVDASLPQGETVKLTGAQAVTFVRARRNVDDETNLARMERQRQYLEGLLERLVELDRDEILTAYDQIHDYTVTDLGSQTLVDLAETLKKYTGRELLTIDGESRVEDGYAAFYLDERSLQNMVLKLFYAEKGDEHGEQRN